MSGPAASAAGVPARPAPVKIRRYQPEDRDAVARLNARFAAAGVPHVLYPENELHVDREDDSPEKVRERLFVAAQDGEIRAGVFLKEQPFWIRGRIERMGWLKYPVSESLADRAYAAIPGSLIMSLLREQPRLMALGLGGHEGPFAQLLARLRFVGSVIPTWYMMARPSRVLRELPHLRRTAKRRAAMDFLALSGLGWLGATGFDLARSVRGRANPRGYRAVVEPRFGQWADEIWRAVRDRYDAIAVRTAEILNPHYSEIFTGLDRLRVERDGQTIGWVCAYRFAPRPGDAAAQYGQLTVGIVADALAAPEHATGVTVAAVRHLKERGADLIIGSQSHLAWQRALDDAGLLSGPSNFAFYRSPASEKLLQGPLATGGAMTDASPAVDANAVAALSVINRGDCDGLPRHD